MLTEWGHMGTGSPCKTLSRIFGSKTNSRLIYWRRKPLTSPSARWGWEQDTDSRLPHSDLLYSVLTTCTVGTLLPSWQHLLLNPLLDPLFLSSCLFLFPGSHPCLRERHPPGPSWDKAYRKENISKPWIPKVFIPPLHVEFWVWSTVDPWTTLV